MIVGLKKKHPLRRKIAEGMSFYKTLIIGLHPMSFV